MANKTNSMNQAEQMGVKVTPTAEGSNFLNCVANYKPEVSTFMVDSLDGMLLKIERVLIFADAAGEITVRQVLLSSFGWRVAMRDEDFEYVFTTPVDNVITQSDIDYYYSEYMDEDSHNNMMEICLENFRAWHIDTVQMDNGGKIPLQEYLKNYLLKE